MEKTIKSDLLYSGKILSLKLDLVETESGRITHREVVTKPDTVSILAVDGEDDVLLVRQYRYAIGDYSLEIPAGSVDEGETPVEAAVRELREETGYKCNHIKKLIAYHPSIGYSQEKMTLFLGRELEFCPLLGDEDDISLEKVSFDSLYEKVAGGRSPFMDAKSNMAMFLAHKIIRGD